MASDAMRAKDLHAEMVELLHGDVPVSWAIRVTLCSRATFNEPKSIG